MVERLFSVEDADCFCSQILSGRQVNNFCEPVNCYDVLFVDLREDFLSSLSDIMDDILAGNDQLQTNQPNGQASG